MEKDYLALIKQIDASGHDVTSWEADYIESLLKNRPRFLSERQKAIIDRMAGKYLPLDHA